MVCKSLAPSSIPTLIPYTLLNQSTYFLLTVPFEIPSLYLSTWGFHLKTLALRQDYGFELFTFTGTGMISSSKRVNRCLWKRKKEKIPQSAFKEPKYYSKRQARAEITPSWFLRQSTRLWPKRLWTWNSKPVRATLKLSTKNVYQTKLRPSTGVLLTIWSFTTDPLIATWPTIIITMV